MHQLVEWSTAGVCVTAVIACDVIDTNVCVTTAEGDVILYNTEDKEVSLLID